MDHPLPALAEGARRARARARDTGLRALVFAAACALSVWHYDAHDGWWGTPSGAVAHTLLSVAIVAAGAWSGRLLGLLLVCHQAVFVVFAFGAAQAAGAWTSADAVVYRVWEPQRGAECRVEPDTRLRSCPLPEDFASCSPGPDYRDAVRFGWTVTTRVAAAVWGPPPGSYLGPIPTEAEAFALVAGATPVELTASASLGVEGLPGSDGGWRGARSLGVVRLDDPAGPATLLVWDGGAVLDLYDARTGRLVTTWSQPGRAPVTRRRAMGSNALWLRRRWLHAATSDADVDALLVRARAHDIDMVYPFVGPMRPDGRFGWRDGDTLVEYPPETARRFFARVRAAGRGVPTVLPSTGGVLGRDAFPEVPEWRAEFVAQAKALVDLGADGVHVNIEPMAEGTPGYLDLLRELDAALGPDKLVSVAAYPPPTPLHPFADVHWSTGFLAQVCRIADDVSVMAYDTALETPEAYAALMTTWTAEIAPALDLEGRRCTWRIGVPTYDEDKPWHRPGAETLSAALDGVIAALGDRQPRGFAGLAVYASWTTEPADWAEFDIRWRGTGPEEVGWVDEP